MYTIKTVYFDKGLKFVVLNNHTKVIQSTWDKYLDASNTTKSLNRHMSKQTSLTNNKSCEIINIKKGIKK